jgi:hypothetical protein
VEDDYRVAFEAADASLRRHAFEALSDEEQAKLVHNHNLKVHK